MSVRTGIKIDFIAAWFTGMYQRSEERRGGGRSEARIRAAEANAVQPTKRLQITMINRLLFCLLKSCLVKSC
jgi:hypothetical protein